jgi:hypothetical protein
VSTRSPAISTAAAKLSERLRIANALPAGPEGGGGIELRVTLAPEWEAAVGGVYRSERWRLGSGGPYPGDVAETRWVPVFARVSRQLGGRSSLDLYGGALFSGRLRIMNGDGHEVVGDDFKTAPAFAITLSIKPGRG